MIREMVKYLWEVGKVYSELREDGFPDQNFFVGVQVLLEIFAS